MCTTSTTQLLPPQPQERIYREKKKKCYREKYSSLTTVAGWVGESHRTWISFYIHFDLPLRTTPTTSNLQHFISKYKAMMVWMNVRPGLPLLTWACSTILFIPAFRGLLKQTTDSGSYGSSRRNSSSFSYFSFSSPKFSGIKLRYDWGTVRQISLNDAQLYCDVNKGCDAFLSSFPGADSSPRWESKGYWDRSGVWPSRILANRYTISKVIVRPNVVPFTIYKLSYTLASHIYC